MTVVATVAIDTGNGAHNERMSSSRSSHRTYEFDPSETRQKLHDFRNSDDTPNDGVIRQTKQL